MADERFIKITLVRSPIGYRKYQRVTAETLGLRKLHATVVHRETPAIRGMVTQIGHLLKVEEVDAPEQSATTPKPVRQPKFPAKPPVEQPVQQPIAAPTASDSVDVAESADIAESVAVTEVEEAETTEITETEAPAKPARKSANAATAADDLTKVEGIGPKMSSALVAAGIDSYAKLAEASEADIRSAIENAGMRLAPGLETWAEQAQLAAQGDWDGLKELQGGLTGGRRVD